MQGSSYGNCGGGPTDDPLGGDQAPGFDDVQRRDRQEWYWRVPSSQKKDTGEEVEKIGFDD